ncbi:hypothetical protein HY214_05385 [Candidatus Roizmanbacteria bacterium]|nr:hypothetical protein [Candidatus Roizmanbacteria bacterium]
MPIKSGPVFFLGSLLVILAFIVGVRYGQRVEKTNKAIDRYLSTTPVTSAAPATVLEFKTYKNSGCGVRFLLPTVLNPVKETTFSAEFLQGKITKLTFDCQAKSALQNILNDPSVATAELNFKNTPLSGKQTDGKMYVMKIVNPKNGRAIFIAVDSSFYPLFEKGLEFSL